MTKNLRTLPPWAWASPSATRSPPRSRARRGPGPNPVPLTREDMKKALEDSKRNGPRLPLPPLTEEEKAKAAEAARPGRAARGLGGGIINNGRMRSYYLSDYADGLEGGLFGLGGFGGGASADARAAPAAIRDRPSTTRSRR